MPKIIPIDLPKTHLISTLFEDKGSAANLGAGNAPAFLAQLAQGVSFDNKMPNLCTPRPPPNFAYVVEIQILSSPYDVSFQYLL